MTDQEYLTEPFALPEADELASESGEGQVDILETLLVNGETAEAVAPSHD